MRGPLIRRIQTTAASMDDSLRLIQHLYGEDVDDPTFDRRLTEDDELREEYEQLQATKDVLDRRSPPSPDPAVVDQVVERAADAAQNGAASDDARERASDRAAQAPDRTWSRRLRGVSTALALLLIVGLGVWQLRSDGPTTGEMSASESASQQQAASVAVGAEQGQSTESIPEWDDRDELVRLNRRIEQVRSRSRTDDWGALQTVNQTSP